MVIGRVRLDASVEQTGLEYHPLREQETAPERLVGLLQEFRAILQTDGMASMDEYGDMLKWALPGRDGMCRYFHAFHPGFCSWGDAFYGTIHTHGGKIRGTVLAGAMDHCTYDATPDPDGDRSYGGKTYRLTKHTRHQIAGTSYALAANVPHWLVPKELTVTYFEEEDNEEMGDLVNPATELTDDHAWTQDDADDLLPGLMGLIDERLERLLVSA